MCNPSGTTFFSRLLPMQAHSLVATIARVAYMCRNSLATTLDLEVCRPFPVFHPWLSTSATPLFSGCEGIDAEASSTQPHVASATGHSIVPGVPRTQSELKNKTSSSNPVPAREMWAQNPCYDVEVSQGSANPSVNRKDRVKKFRDKNSKRKAWYRRVLCVCFYACL